MPVTNTLPVKVISWPCARLMLAIGGEARAEARLGGGTRFVLEAQSLQRELIGISGPAFATGA